MKKIMTLSICLLATITSIASSFSSNLSFSFDEGKNKEITLTLNDVKEGQVLSVKDIDGFVLYKKAFEKTDNNASHKFDFTDLPNGTYYFEHEKAYQTKVIPFKVHFGDVTFDEANVKTIYKPVVRVKDNNIYFSKLELNKEDVEVRIYFEEDQGNHYKLVHTETISDALKAERVFSLSKKHTGNYKIVTVSNDKEYIEYIKI
ncbi:hypothetical protein [Formosa haliotis]|uniref:hypothetical protein n=1 Tax=Formosa haliotis TaxID=1555194 RepID=UPI0008258D0B|nr:hypothetical protein [Formosa haliotis]